MSKYVVNVREVHISIREVEAENAEAAIDKALELGSDCETSFEYSHTMDRSHHTAEKIQVG